MWYGGTCSWYSRLAYAAISVVKQLAAMEKRLACYCGKRAALPPDFTGKLSSLGTDRGEGWRSPASGTTSEEHVRLPLTGSGTLSQTKNAFLVPREHVGGENERLYAPR